MANGSGTQGRFGGDSALRPAMGFRFSVSIPQRGSMSSWAKISDTGNESEVLELKQVTRSDGVSKYPGIPRYAPITLSRGASDDEALAIWREEVMDHASGRRTRPSGMVADVEISVFDRLGERPVKVIALYKAWPSGLRFAGLNAGSSGFLFEALTLVFDQMEIITPP